MKTAYVSILSMLVCSACASGAAEQDPDLVADQFVEMRAGIECADAAKGDKNVNSSSVFEDCLDIGDADQILRSGAFDNPESVRLFAWLAWDSAHGISQLKGERFALSTWDDAASFAQCVEKKARSEDGFFSGKGGALGGAWNAARKACADHPLSLHSMMGKPLDLSDPTIRKKMLASSLSRLSILAALSQADACPSPEPTCLPNPPASSQDPDLMPVPEPRAETAR